MDAVFAEDPEPTILSPVTGTYDDARSPHATLERATVVSYRVRLHPDAALDAISDGIRDLTGYHVEEVIADAQWLWRVVHPEDRARLDTFLADAGQSTGLSTIRLVHRDGRILHAEHVAFVARNDRGVATEVEGVVRDVTSLWRPAVVDGSTGATRRDLTVVAYLADASGFTVVNPAILALTGFTAEEWIRQPTLWAERLHPDDRARVVMLAAAGATGHAWQAEYRWLARDGHIVPVHQASAPIRDARGELVGLHGVLLDGAARTPGPGASTETQRMEAIARAAGIVAHDFNNILSVVLGHAEMLLDNLPSLDPGRRSALEIKNAAERAARVTSQLLAISGHQVFSVSVVDINDVIRDCSDTLCQLAGGDIDLQFDLASDLPAVEVDVKQVERVLRNLVLDGREASVSGGHVTIATRAGDCDGRREILLTISDTRPAGSGDAPLHTFEPTVPRRKTIRGAGLNRAAVHGIVRQLGGRISASAVVGGGLAFTIGLPAQAP